MNDHHFRTCRRFIVLLLFFQGTPLAGQQNEITVEWIYSDEGERPSALPRYVWVESGEALLYDTRQPKDQRTLERLDPRTGRRSPAVDKDRALKSLRSILSGGEATESLSWPQGFDRDGRRALYLFDGDLFLLELASSTFQRATRTPAEEKSVRFSPDGNKIAFVRDNDLFIYDIVDEKEKRLTEDGAETILNGTLSWVYWEEIFGRYDTGYWWSEDSGAIAFLRSDESSVSVMHYLDFSPAVPRVVQQRYPKTGEANPVVRLGVIDLETDRTSWLDSSETPYEYLIRVKWLPDSRRVSFQTLNRMQNRLGLYLMERESGETTHVLTETDPAWVNVHDDLHFLSDGSHFIWASERDGYAHLYRYTMKGEPVNQITRGEWPIRASSGVYWVRQGVAAIDEKEGWIYFTALEKSSTERHLYRIRFDGSGMERISSEDGTHRVTFSPDARYYFDAYSTSSTLPSLSLRDNRGGVSAVIASAQTELLADFDMQYPESVSIPASDGFLLPAQISKPADFDPSHRYPVILNVYGGPAGPIVSNAWSSRAYFDQILLESGYLVVRVDNRTATATGKDLENLVLEDLMSDGELSDLVDAVGWLKSQTYVDPDRVGIWGWSGGGTFTLLAMTRSQEFKAGIAVAPVSDFRYYDTKWAEAYMKTPQSNPEGYEKTSLVRQAKNLHGRLLLVHGTFDDNVHPQNSWHFIDELIQAGKPVDMMMYPKRKHGISDRPARIHLYKKMLEFWKKHL